MPQEHTQEFQVTAADQVGDRERVPEQMRMKPIYTGADLQILKEHLHRVGCKRTLRIAELTEHISGSNTGALVILLQCADQKVRDQHKPAFVFLGIDYAMTMEKQTHDYQKYQLVQQNATSNYLTFFLRIGSSLGLPSPVFSSQRVCATI